MLNDSESVTYVKKKKRKASTIYYTCKTFQSFLLCQSWCFTIDVFQGFSELPAIEARVSFICDYFIEAPQRAKVSWHQLKLRNLRTEFLIRSPTDMHEIWNCHKNTVWSGQSMIQFLSGISGNWGQKSKYVKISC